MKKIERKGTATGWELKKYPLLLVGKRAGDERVHALQRYITWGEICFANTQ
jgi:hypothetical protein